MKKSFLILIAVVLINFVYGQEKKLYSDLITEAETFIQAKEYLKAGNRYSEAFTTYSKQIKDVDRYNAACSWALANQPDSAFAQLFLVKENLSHITTDDDLNTLHSDKRWDQILQLAKQNEEKLNQPLVEKLTFIYQEDQKYRSQIPEIEKQYGRNSEEMKAHWKLIQEKDSLNLMEITKILDERGWLGQDVIGQMGNLTLFLVIQHADIKTQEKYLPMMRDAVSKGNANPDNLALLEDRVALRQGKRQIYGSQIYQDAKTGTFYIAPLEDPENVDKRRSEVGLGKFQDYLSKFGLKWNAEEYIKALPELEAKHKRK